MTSKTESMTHEEALSALVDGELDGLPRNRMLGRLLEDPELRARWSRYHAGRATLEGADPGLIGAGFSDRVAAAISDEPPIAAPARVPVENRPRPRRPVAALAVAAVVAVIAVGALLVLRGDAFESPPDVVAERDTGRSAEPLDQALPLADGTFGEELAPGERDRVRQRLAMYLNSHNRFSDAGEMPHVMPGSRLVAFNAAP